MDLKPHSEESQGPRSGLGPGLILGVASGPGGGSRAGLAKVSKQSKNACGLLESLNVSFRGTQKPSGVQVS